MRIVQNRPTQIQVTFHPYELATLVSAARWIVGGATGELPPEAVGQLKQVLSNYDRAQRQEKQTTPAAAGTK